MHTDQESTWRWNEAGCPLMIRVLGAFQVLNAEGPVAVPSRGKAQALLSTLALHYAQSVPRDKILEHLWPTSDSVLAAQSLNSLVYSLQKQLGRWIGGGPPVVHAHGYYRLNREAGVSLDLACFEALIRDGDQHRARGELAEAAACYKNAAGFYQGDLWDDTDLEAVVERERLRAAFLTILAWLADYHYGQGDYSGCLQYAQQLLAADSCREDAHRLVMRCHVRRDERAQALRQYRVCAEILRGEFDTKPEPATVALFEQVRLDPDSI